MVLFRLLGPLEVRARESWTGVSAPKWRGLLAALLAEPGQVVSVERLTDELWGEDAPSGARKLVSGYVLRLRRLLGDPGGRVLVTRAPGYQLTVSPADIDAAVFEDLLAAGREALEAAEPARAGKLLGEALSLWRGPALADVPLGPLSGTAAERLEEMRLTAVELRMEADLSCGRAAGLVPGLRQLTGEHPLRERLWLQLMRALEGCGRPAEALEVYARVRKVLGTELGADPGPDLQQLHQGILSAASPASAASRPVTVPWQMPTAPSHFVGRDAELAALTGLIEQAAGASAVRIAVIGGTAGVGKTALALHWARQVYARFPDGQLYASLRGFAPSGTPVSPGEAISGFLDALGVAPERVPASLDAQTALFRSLLAGKRMLIILDNARDTEQVRPLLPGSPGCLVVVTGRRQLSGLIAIEGACPLTLDVLTEAEARDLLVGRLGDARISREQAAVTKLTRLCARLPLALAVVAARAAVRPRSPLSALAAELGHTGTRLDALDAGDAASSVREVLAWSYQSLTGSAARMFRLLGLHPGPDISASAAAHLAGFPPSLARRALGELTGSHMLSEHVPGRFTFHDLLHTYAIDQARACETETERHTAIHQMLDHYLYTAHSAALLLYPASDHLAVAPPQPGSVPESLTGQAQALAWLTAEHQVLLAVIVQAADAGFDTHAAQLAESLATYLDRRGNWQDCTASQRTALAALRRLDDRAGQARAHRFLGRALIRLESYEDGLAHLTQAMSLFREFGDCLGQGRAHLAIGLALWQQGRPRDALRHAQHALPLYESAGHRIGQAAALNHIGAFSAQIGDHAQALTCSQRALGLHRALGNTDGEAEALGILGHARHIRRQHAEAIACYQQAIRLFGEIGNRYNEAEVLDHLGDTQHAAGDPMAARNAWRQALEILDDLAHPSALQVRAKL